MISAFRRISISEHLAAKERLDPARTAYRIFRLPCGAEFKMALGTVDLDDYTRRDGHAVRVAFDEAPFPDRFGWPVGDPRSPASLYA